jgi:N-hydroxyarylamine O-acetyltransferase
VGFGDSFSEPLALDDPMPHKQGNKSFRVVHENDDYWMMQELDADGNMVDAYRFTLRPRALYEFTYGCHYHQTSPDTGFARKVVCSLPVPEGRLTVSGMQFIKTINGQREERALATAAERLTLLRDCFNINLPDDVELKSPVG